MKSKHIQILQGSQTSFIDLVSNCSFRASDGSVENSSTVGVEHDSEGGANSLRRKVVRELGNDYTVVTVSSADSAPDGLVIKQVRNMSFTGSFECLRCFAESLGEIQPILLY